MQWRCLRGGEECSSYPFLNLLTGWGEWSASRPSRTLPPGKRLAVPTVQEAVWAPEAVWTQRLEAKSSASVGDRTPLVHFVVKHSTDSAYMHIKSLILEIA
jgi:hypothetical protein